MYIFNEVADADGAWHLVKIGGDFRFSMRDSDALGGGTVKIETADGGKRAFPTSTDRTFTAKIEPTIITLCEGEHVRITLTGAGSGADVNVDAQHTTEQGDVALAEV